MTDTPLLIVEDDPDLAGEIQFFLERHGFNARVATCGADVDPWVRAHGAGVVLLDLGLPDEDGIHIARRLVEWPDLRVVMLTARSTVEDRIEGFQAGADVYLTKPVDMGELLAVVSRVSRRLPPSDARWGLDPRQQELRTPDGQVVPLTTQEAAFLQLLAESPDATADRRRIEAHLWGELPIDTDRRLEVMVARLRKKIRTRSDRPEDVIKTRWRGGYQLTVLVAVRPA